MGYVSRMPLKRLPKQTLIAKVNEKRSVERHRTRWLDYIKDLGCNSMGLRPCKMQSVLVDREVWQLNLDLLPTRNLQEIAIEEKKEIQ